MDQGRWYEGQTLHHHHHPQERSAIPAYPDLDNAPETQQPSSYQRALSMPSHPFRSPSSSLAAAATSAQYAYHLHHAAQPLQPAHYRQASFDPFFSPSNAAAASSDQYAHQVVDASEAQQVAHYQRTPTRSLIPFSSAPSSEGVVTSAKRASHTQSHSLNPSSIPWRDASAPSSSHLYEHRSAGGNLQLPEVDVYSLNPQGQQMVYNGHAMQYAHLPVGTGSYYHGLASGDAVGFSAKDAIRQYGVDPLAYGSIPGKSPTFSMHENKAIYPRDGTARKNRKIDKVLQSAYCKVCKVDCKSQEVLKSHRQGKKHKKNLEKLKESFGRKPANALTAAGEKKGTPKAGEDKTEGDRSKERPALKTEEVDLETKKRRLLEEGATADAMRECTICNVVCNSEIVFKYHIAGQKHATMMKKQASVIS